MKTKFYLVRHGEAEINLNPLQKTETDILTERGLEQAHRLAERFRKSSIENICTSKISRALLTAKKIGSALNLTPVIVESLKERKASYTNQQDYFYNESFEDFKLRLVETRKFLEADSEESVVIVSHALFIRGLIAYITFGDLLTEELLHRLNEVFVIEHGAITKLLYNKEKAQWKIDYLNDRGHLGN